MDELNSLTRSQLQRLRHRILGELSLKTLDHAARNALLILLGKIDQRLAAAQTPQMKGPRYGRL